MLIKVKTIRKTYVKMKTWKEVIKSAEGLQRLVYIKIKAYNISKKHK